MKISTFDTLGVDVDPLNELHIVVSAQTNYLLRDKVVDFQYVSNSINTIGYDWIKVSVNNGELLALNSSPKEIVDAGATNYARIPVMGFVRYNYTSSVFATDTEIILTDGTNVLSNTLDILGIAAVTYATFIIKDCIILPENPVYLTTPTDDPINGAGTLDIWLLWQQLITVTQA